MDKIFKRKWQSLTVGIALVAAGAGAWWTGTDHLAAPMTSATALVGTYGVFAEPLVPFSAYTAVQEGSLQAAIAAYRAAGDAAQVQPLLTYLQQNPASPWRAALLANLALLHDRLGYIGQAVEDWHQAELALTPSQTPAQRALADLITGEQLRLHARLGHKDTLQALLSRSAGMTLSGAAGEQQRQARATLWEMNNTPASVLRCGLIALHEVLAEGHAPAAVLARIEGEPAKSYGTSLSDLDALARREGLALVMRQRAPGAPVPVPAVVHWKQGHFAAVLARRGDHFHIRDAALGRDAWVSQDVLDQESSGYFLTAAQVPQAGWLAVSAAAGQRVVGAGPTNSTNPIATGLDDSTDCGNGQGAGSSPGLSGQGSSDGDSAACPPIGMPTYQVQSMLVSLSLRDQPLDYTPPKGPDVSFLLAYSQADTYQPANFSFSNLGPKWTHNWLSYIQDDPTTLGSNVLIYKRGGGAWSYTGYNASNGNFDKEGKTLAQLVLVSTSPLIYERRFGDGSKEVFSQPDGATLAPRRVFLTQVVDRAGNVVTLGYDSQQRLTTLTDAAGQQSTFAYQATNPLLITRISDPFGRAAQLSYDSNGRLQGITDAIGMSSSFAYVGTGGDVSSMTTPYGTTSFAYGGSGIQRWIEITDPLNQKERVEFAHTAPGIPFSDPVAPTGAGNNQYLNYRNTFYWDKAAMKLAAGDYTQARIKHWLHMPGGFSVTSPVLESIKYPRENRVWYYYPSQPNPLQIGSVWKPSAIARVLDNGTSQYVRTTYNDVGRITSTVDPLGRTTYYDFAAGNPYDVTQIRQVSGAQTEVVAQYTYNSQHLPVTYTDAAGQVTRYTYNAAGQRTAVTNAKSETTQYQYNGSGYLTAVINANGKTQASLTYDTAGRVASRTDSEGYVLRYQYDALNRLTTTTFPDGSTKQQTWDRLDQASSTNRLGQTTTYSHDALRRLTAITDPLSQVTHYGYYENGQLKTLTDARGNTTTWNRDIEGRVTSKVYANGNTTTYAYDAANRPIMRTDPLGQVRQTAYTADDQVMGYTYVRGGTGTSPVSFAYDALYPRLSSMLDGTGTTTFQYQAAGTLGAGQLASEIGPDGGSATLQTRYDELGRPLQRQVGPDNETFVYDPLSRVTQHQSALGTFLYQYLGSTGQVTSERLGGARWQSVFTYGDNAHDRQLQSISHANANQSLLDVLWHLLQSLLSLLGLNAAPVAGQVPTITYVTGPEFQMLSRSDNTGTRTWRYDARQRLTSGATGSASNSYGYDAADNLVSTGNALISVSLPANTVNQLISRAGQAWTYDANGNVLDDGRNTYTWDAENRLTQISNKTTGQVSEFRYDGLSRRVAILERASAGALATETRYLWCGDRICQARDASGNVTARFFPQGETSVVAGSPVLSYYAKDNLGSVVQMVDTTGAAVGEQRYTDYGGLESSTGKKPTFGYAGMFQHNPSALSLTQYRAYDSSTGRWLSRDPIEEAGGLNLYGYVGGNPISLIDPYGLAGACPQVPVAPANVNLNKNIATAENMSIYNIFDVARFISLVRNHGAWDYKRFGNGSEYEDFGNFNFGATAEAMGWPYYVAQNGAGAYQQLYGAAGAGAGSVLTKWPYGDDPKDAKQIQSGYQYGKNNCGCAEK